MFHLIAIITLIASGILLVSNSFKKQKKRAEVNDEADRQAQMYGSAFSRFSCTVDEIILSISTDSSIEKVLERIEIAHAKESQQMIQDNGRFFSEQLLRARLKRAANRFSMIKGD